MTDVLPNLTQPANIEEPLETSSVLHKRILSKEHLEAFQASQTYKDVVEFIEELNQSIIGVKLGEAGPESEVSGGANSLEWPVS